MSTAMTKLERITRAIRGQEVDHIPAAGGWVHGVRNLAKIAGITVEQYMADPMKAVLAANRVLDVDMLLPLLVPKDVDQIREGLVEESSFAGIEPEALKEYADTLPDTEAEVAKRFDAAEFDAKTRKWVVPFVKAYAENEIVYMPNFWDLGGAFPLYQRWGYEAFLMACSMYPESIAKIWWYEHTLRKYQGRVVLPMFKEFNWPPMMFSGDDVCNNKGPMVSPDFLRQYFWPGIKDILQPFIDEGIRIVHHCDGDVRPVVQDMLNTGFSGFQGFQYECDVDIAELRKLRSNLGETPIFLAGLSVTRTLPYGNAQDVRDEIDYMFDATDGGKGMIMFTSNVTGVEVPPENLMTAYSYLKTLKWGAKRPNPHKQWPWLVNHPETK